MYVLVHVYVRRRLCVPHCVGLLDVVAGNDLTHLVEYLRSEATATHVALEMGNVVFRDVCAFRWYEPLSEAICDDVEQQFGRGTTIAVVGRPGVGKSYCRAYMARALSRRTRGPCAFIFEAASSVPRPVTVIAVRTRGCWTATGAFTVTAQLLRSLVPVTTLHSLAGHQLRKHQVDNTRVFQSLHLDVKPQQKTR